MGRPNPRGRAFLFYPQDYLRDPAVRRMSLAAKGAYSTLLFALWDEQNPGVCDDDDRILAHLAGATPEEWISVRDQVASAFKIRNGKWSQKRMVETHRAQSRQARRWKELGRVGGKTRRNNELASHPTSQSQGWLKRTGTGTRSSTGTGTGTASEEAVGSGTSPPADLEAELGARFPTVDLDLVWVKVLEDGPCKNLRNKFRNWCRKAHENGWDQKPKTLTFGTEEPA